ncbi:hypothetical protein [Tessaracoccus coleopterorum]|uniref:hypothetical protein n=1 Tax=Tessaracoccus coleopterorum TaxID=2714950 RepID=UPI001E653199|nr:hypothetical protein [Tessaracoccus coleopterorum]
MISRARTAQAQATWEKASARLQSPWARRLLTVAAVVGCWLLLFGVPGGGFLPYRIDLDVYRLGAEVLLRAATSTGRFRRPRQGSACPSRTHRSRRSCSSRSRCCPCGRRTCC